MSSIKVVDVNNEEVKQEEPIEEPIEEAKEEVNEIPDEAPPQEKTEVVEEVKAETKPVKAQDKLITCPKCNKSMKLKSYRYKHEKTCSGTLEQKAVKPFSKPRATPKPKAQPIIQEVQEVKEVPQPKLTQPVSNQILQPQPRNPLNEITNHCQILHQQYIQQKKEKYDALCKNMFSTKMKKR